MAVESQSAKLYRKEPIRRRFFGLKAARPRAEPGTVVVLTGGQAPIVLWPGQKSTPGEAAWNKYDTMYTIDTGRREFAMNDVLVPAKGGDVHFRVHFSASYRISDPVLIIEEDIVDARPILMRVLTESISRITEKFDIEEVEEARNAVRDMLDKGKFIEKLPFELSAKTVKIEHDSEAKEFLSKRRKQRQDAKLLQEKHELITSEAEAKLLEQQFDLKIQDVQNRFQLMLDKQKVESTLEIQKLRLEVYKPMIEGGLWSMLVQRLAQEPGDIDEVSQMIVDMHSRQVAADVTVLSSLIEGDMIEDRDLKDVTSRLVRKLQADLGGPMAPGAGPRRLESSDAEEHDRAEKER